MHSQIIYHDKSVGCYASCCGIKTAWSHMYFNRYHDICLVQNSKEFHSVMKPGDITKEPWYATKAFWFVTACESESEQLVAINITFLYVNFVWIRKTSLLQLSQLHIFVCLFVYLLAFIWGIIWEKEVGNID